MKKSFSNVKSCVNIYEVTNLELYMNHSFELCIKYKYLCYNKDSFVSLMVEVM